MLRSLRRALLLMPLLTASTFIETVPALAVPAAVTIDGPDVSSYQHPAGASINWHKVAAAGHAFAIVKATEGTTYVNRYFRRDYTAIRQAGMVRGSYHYAHPGYPLASSALAQASFYVRHLGSAATSKTLPPALDLEETGGLSRAALVTWSQDFLLDVRHLTGRTPMIYSYPWFWKYAVGDAPAFARYPLWMASYHGQSPEAGTTLWQYTAGAKVKGIKGPVDMSRLLADRATFDTMADGVTPTLWPDSPPGSPTLVQGVPEVHGATARWLPPDAGSSAIVDYTVTISPADGSSAPQTRTVPATTTSATFAGLTSGVPYVVTVAARNSVGSGPTAASSVVPQSPTQLTLSSPWTLSYGTPATLQAVLTDAATGAPLAGMPTSVSIRPAGAVRWTTLGTSITDAAGLIEQSLAPTASVDVRIDYRGSTGEAPATVVRHIVVRRVVSASLSSTRTTPGHRVQLLGRTTPVARRVQVICQQYAGGSWHAIQRQLTGRFGRYRFNVTTKTSRSSTYRVVIAATSTLDYGVSPAVVLSSA